MILVLSTFSNKKEAKGTGNELLNKKLIACYNILPIESAYWWKNKIKESNEILMLIKTKKENLDKIERFISKNHSYDTPEVISIEPNSVNEKYLNWIKEVC